MEASVVNSSNQSVGNVTLPAAFEARVNDAVLFDQVLAQLASRRAGTHATKTRGFVSGGGKKPFKQKGTGRARAGSTRSPIWRGGATIFGPQPRSYEYRLPSSTPATRWPALSPRRPGTPSSRWWTASRWRLRRPATWRACSPRSAWPTALWW